MKSSKVLMVVLSVGVVGLAVWLMFVDQPSPNAAVVHEKTIEEKTVTSASTPVLPPNPNRGAPSLAKQAPKGEDVVVSEEMAVQFSRIAQTFESELDFPPYSQPILDSASPYLSPNHFSVVEMPVLDGTDSAALVMDKYRYFFPEPLSFKVKSGLAVESMSFSLIDTETRSVVATGTSENQRGELFAKDSWPANVRLRVVVEFESGTDVLTADINYQNPVAYVLSLQPSYVAGADWVLPLDVDAKLEGLYRLRANLYQSDGIPVAVLVSKQRLTLGENVMDLKAHQSVFGGMKGEYQLRDLQLERMSGFPGEDTRYGVSVLSVIELGEFDAGDLSGDAYEPSEQEQQQLLFLKSLAGEV
ncbi:hypothetical protein LRP50_13965 [Enterovibrio sp. ZSDZ42]|uniref:Uncharacterized protein n=1 Tax=Enterovibrio gelatinilyticus TaxID=2899819 RepID=A0ABT5R1T5_9GAMM|nr:hypothetical protein [Enterovibrio sp. ZSDZ42]MDD1794243.1 hypothetical protein [Enterovibrio sp. ZSDZ42]